MLLPATLFWMRLPWSMITVWAPMPLALMPPPCCPAVLPQSVQPALGNWAPPIVELWMATVP